MHSDEQKRGTVDGGLCYFLVCYSRLEFVAFLVASLLRPEDTFLIHCDKKAPDDLKRYVALISYKYDNILEVESRDYSWAGFSHVATTLVAVETALAQASNWSHFICLSEQHLPLKSPSKIQTYLRARKSVAKMTVASSMLHEAQADIYNRFAAYYRELPGVGCFAVASVSPCRDLLNNVCHGSNWLALHRDHCNYLLRSEQRGEFKKFENIVHAEEMAFPSILAPLRNEIEQLDVTLVAAPHLVENRGLEMTDALYLQSISGQHLFIRKRTEELSEPILSYIRSCHFREDIFADRLLVALKSQGHENSSDSSALAIVQSLTSLFKDRFAVECIDPAQHAFSCKLHVILRAHQLGEKRSIRVLSQNLKDFKVCLIEENSVGDVFPPPCIIQDALHSTLRVKLSSFFGYHEITPLSIADAGFVTIQHDRNLDDIAATVNDLYRFAQTSSALPADVSTKKACENMTRASRVNRLAELVNAKRYLEIGVCFGETFFEVNAPEKVAVDPNFRFDYVSRQDKSTTFHPVTSDKYFEWAPSEAFDLIYLDGLHTFDQTSRDFFNSLRLAHEKTIWLIDDTVPNDVFSSLPSQAECYHLRAQTGNSDPSWMGDVYKCIYLIERTLPFYSFRTFEGHGQTVIWRSKKARLLSPVGVDVDNIGRITFVEFMKSQSLLGVTSDEDIYAAIQRDFA